MKIRTNFISNSSASSYICDVCGESEVGWESPDGFRDCITGHSLCQNCQDFEPIFNEAVDLSLKDALQKLGIDEDDVEMSDHIDWESWDEEVKYDYLQGKIDGYELPEGLCPICSFDVVIDKDIVAYLQRTTNIKWETVFIYVKSMNKRRKKLRDEEYITYVCNELKTNTIELTEKIKKTYKDYDTFQRFLRRK